MLELPVLTKIVPLLLSGLMFMMSFSPMQMTHNENVYIHYESDGNKNVDVVKTTWDSQTHKKIKTEIIEKITYTRKPTSKKQVLYDIDEHFKQMVIPGKPRSYSVDPKQEGGK